MARFGHDTAHGENAFGLTFPEKRAVELRLADKRAWLITNIDQVGGHHRHGKGDSDRVAVGNLSARWLDNDAPGIRFRVRYFLVLFFVSLRSCQGGRRTKCDTACYEKQHRYLQSPAQLIYGLISLIRRRSASASATFPMRRWHCSRSLKATSDSLISIERVCDVTAPAKSARCFSITPRKNHLVESFGSSSVAIRACNSASFWRSKASRTRAASNCAAADLSSIANAAFASAKESVN